MLQSIEHQTQNGNTSASLIANVHTGECTLQGGQTKSKEKDKQSFIFQHLNFLFFSILFLLSSCGEFKRHKGQQLNL